MALQIYIYLYDACFVIRPVKPEDGDRSIDPSSSWGLGEIGGDRVDY